MLVGPTLKQISKFIGIIFSEFVVWKILTYRCDAAPLERNHQKLQSSFEMFSILPIEYEQYQISEFARERYNIILLSVNTV